MFGLNGDSYRARPGAKAFESTSKHFEGIAVLMFVAFHAGLPPAAISMRPRKRPSAPHLLALGLRAVLLRVPRDSYLLGLAPSRRRGLGGHGRLTRLVSIFAVPSFGPAVMGACRLAHSPADKLDSAERHWASCIECWAGWADSRKMRGRPGERMTVTLTGATGFVGRQILRNLHERGCSVRVLVRDPSRLHDIPAGGAVEVVQTPDLFAETSGRLEELLEGSETLVHAAWYAEPGKYLTSPLNLACLTGTLNLASALAAVGGKRFVGVGTCAEYDYSAGLMTTDTPLAPNTLYATCKASAFQVLRCFLGTKETGFAWCRLFYLYGEGEDERRLVPYIRRQLGAGQEVLLSRGDQVRDFLEVKDAARMIADVALGQQQGAVNICSGEAVTVRQLAERIADEYGRRDLLRFGARPENAFDPPRVVGVR